MSGYDPEAYYEKKRNGLCVDCKSDQLSTNRDGSTSVRCERCKDFISQVNRGRRNLRSAHNSKARRERLKEEGMCVRCARSPRVFLPSRNHTASMCGPCLVAVRRDKTNTAVPTGEPLSIDEFAAARRGA